MTVACLRSAPIVAVLLYIVLSTSVQAEWANDFQEATQSADRGPDVKYRSPVVSSAPGASGNTVGATFGVNIWSAHVETDTFNYVKNETGTMEAKWDWTGDPHGVQTMEAKVEQSGSNFGNVLLMTDEPPEEEGGPTPHAPARWASANGVQIEGINCTPAADDPPSGADLMNFEGLMSASGSSGNGIHTKTIDPITYLSGDIEIAPTINSVSCLVTGRAIVNTNGFRVQSANDTVTIAAKITLEKPAASE